MGFYKSPYSNQRSDSWDLLKRLGRDWGFLWLVCRDFNEVLYAFEKVRGLSRDEHKLKEFRDTLNDYNLMDVGYNSRWFTWKQGNLSNNNIREWLDRGVANEEWLFRFLSTQVRHLVHLISDHCPLLDTNNSTRDRMFVRPFHFEAWWALKATFEESVKGFWNYSTGSLIDKMQYLSTCISSWAR